MPSNQTLTAALLSAVAGLSDTAAAQDVVLSEVVTTGADRWVELHNRGAAAVDVSTWSLYVATATPLRPQNYWWGFRSGTVIAAGGYLRVHWLQAAPATPAPGELYTGDTVPYFLFGLGAEPLPADRGALALFTSQSNSQMNSAAVIADWVTWGTSPLPREALAAQAGRWQSGHAAPAPGAGQSLARDPALVGQLPAPEQEWFVDDSPTPLAANVGPAAVTAIGAPCAVLGHHLLGAPALRPTSPPVLGNGNFGLEITNTTGVLLETCVLGLALGSAPPGLPDPLPAVPGGGCRIWLDYRALVQVTWLPPAPTRTTWPLSLAHVPAAMSGLRFVAQAIVFDFWPTAYPAYQGVTNALDVTIGG